MLGLNFSTLAIRLEPQTKSLWAHFKDSHITAEFLFEFESLLNFLSQHMEIQTLVLQGLNAQFGEGMDPDEILRGDKVRQKKYILHLQKIMVGLMHLPQTVVADLAMGAHAASFELALAADLRVAHQDASFSLNQLAQGHTPSNGGINLLAALTTPVFAQKMVMSGKIMGVRELHNMGLLFDTYEKLPPVEELLKNICTQAPIARIQAKRAFLEGLKDSIDVSLSVDLGLFQGAQVFDDWKKFLECRNKNEKPRFAQAQDLKSFLHTERPQA